MFNQYDLLPTKRVLLWRMYSADAKVNSLVEGNYHSIYNENGEGCVGQGGGYTRSMVENFPNYQWPAYLCTRKYRIQRRQRVIPRCNGES